MIFALVLVALDALNVFVANCLPVNCDICGDDHVAAEDELAGGGLEHCVDGAAECKGSNLEEMIIVRWGVGVGKFEVHELVSDTVVHDAVGASEDGIGDSVGGSWSWMQQTGLVEVAA